MLWACLAWAQVPVETSQLITGWVSDDTSSHAQLQRWVRDPGGWQAVGAPVAARLGQHGVAWGRGLHHEEELPAKIEGDGKAPLGWFAVGAVFADPPAPLLESGWPVVEVGPRDLWVEDPSSPLYNTHVRVPEGRVLTDWETRQRMHLGDPAHALKVVVGHNTVDPVPGQGSAIFFHAWRRDGEAATAGCTALPSDALHDWVHWLRPEAHPAYVLLTESGWARYRGPWGLPAWVAEGTPRTPQERSP